MNEIHFLNKIESSNWIQKYHSTYMNNVISNKLNVNARSYTDIYTYNEHLLDWSLQKKNKIIKLVKLLYDKIPSDWSWLLNTYQWNFILVKNKLESGMPHTIHSAIVLPTKWINNIDMTNSGFLETLLHERIHNYQKMNPSLFHSLYNVWGWQPLKSIPSIIEKTHRYNPDTPMHWIIVEPNNTHIYWLPCVKLHTSSLRHVTYNLVRVNTDLKVIDWFNMKNIKWYNDFYGNMSHCYHPDENVAVLIPNLCFNKNIINSVAIQHLKSWGNKINRIIYS